MRTAIVIIFIFLIRQTSFSKELANKKEAIVLLGINCQTNEKQEIANYISGKVKDSTTNQSLLGAEVYIKNTHIGAITKKDGSFKFYIPNTLLNTEIVLVVRYPGCDIKEIKISPDKLPVKLEIKLTERMIFLKVNTITDHEEK